MPKLIETLAAFALDVAQFVLFCAVTVLIVGLLARLVFVDPSRTGKTAKPNESPQPHEL